MILSAVVGSLSCALLLVIALGVTYRFVRVPSSRRSSRHISPVTAIEEQIYAQRSAPPPYSEAMVTSRPFDEYQREVASRSVQGPPPMPRADDPRGTAATTVDNSDDDLISVGVSESPSGVDGDDIVIALDCLTSWNCRPKPSADGISESSVTPTTSPAVQVADHDPPRGETVIEDHPGDDDDEQPLLM